jgi:ParB family chromosome partitioning protein
MSVRRGGLGRGLGALIPTDSSEKQSSNRSEAKQGRHTGSRGRPTKRSESPQRTVISIGSEEASSEDELTPVPGARFRELPTTAISPNPRQPRLVFEEEALEELKASISEVGVLQPVVVRQVESDKYELIMGERRWRASQAVGRETIPAIIRETSDDNLLRDALLENIHRSNLNPLEEAAAYQQLLQEFGVTHEELSARIGTSRPKISNTIRLLNLSPPVQRRVAAGVLSAGHARALLSLEDHEAQERLAGKIVAEGLSVRATEELVAIGEVPSEGFERRGRRDRPQDPRLAEIADRLSDSFDTRVKIELGRGKGRVLIEFATVDDLERIVTLIKV